MSRDSRWTFAKVTDADLAASVTMPSLDELYRKSLNSREHKRELFQTALNAALENLMSWERIARAEGFAVELITDIGQGKPHSVFDGTTVQFVQAYGARVYEAEEGGAE